MGGGGLSLGAPRDGLTFLRRRPLSRPGLWAGVARRGRHPTTASTEVLVRISITRGRHLLADRYPRVNGRVFHPHGELRWRCCLGRRVGRFVSLSQPVCTALGAARRSCFSNTAKLGASS